MLPAPGGELAQIERVRLTGETSVAGQEAEHRGLLKLGQDWFVGLTAVVFVDMERHGCEEVGLVHRATVALPQGLRQQTSTLQEPIEGRQALRQPRVWRAGLVPVAATGMSPRSARQRSRTPVGPAPIGEATHGRPPSRPVPRPAGKSAISSRHSGASAATTAAPDGPSFEGQPAVVVGADPSASSSHEAIAVSKSAPTSSSGLPRTMTDTISRRSKASSNASATHVAASGAS